MYADAKTASKSIEFVGKRSSDYRDALSHYADVWLPDIACMKRCLAPRPGERILEVGAGNGYFSTAIAECLGPDGLLVASDPSVDQLSGLEADSTHGNIRVVPASADVLDIPFSGFDAVWSRGAIHHVTDKTSAFTRFSALARPGGRLVIADIFAGTPLARYFDGFIARSCSTGHEVAFLSHEFAESLCALTGWGQPTFDEVITPWEFRNREDIGRFLQLLFSAKPDYSAEDCFAAADHYLSVSETASGWALMWPMTVMTAIRPTHG
ncbi:MAG: methyltransferase type 11 [Rhodobacteraceae bacterium]|uniref:class I SAM-dependent methyltransferase n=1 Tax=Stappia stellulata TaxID=71235 RepID=UPI000C415EDC|nr:methyltransferase domain-containing protein [Stappia stellulata]MBC00337.1 methyltransferase type 11 [Paracoccaceae bacterium]MCA1240830.1 methyltransferase domain-containing protein [Stappia stellulata]